ncbi:MAG: protein kinase [Planctomycetales bacterium]
MVARAYMSPEQVQGKSRHLDGRTDVWSLGVILYELLTDRRPFDGSTRAELFEEIEHREPKPLRMIREEISPDLQGIVAACLRKRVEDRRPTALDLATDLRNWLREQARLEVPRADPNIVTIDAPLLAALNDSRDACAARNVLYRTPHLLLAMLEVPSSQAANLFDQIHPGLETQIRDWLSDATQEYKSEQDGGKPFVPFLWGDRADVQAAQELAARDAVGSMNETHLLRAVLESGSSTAHELKNWLDEQTEGVDAHGIIGIRNTTTILAIRDDGEPGQQESVRRRLSLPGGEELIGHEFGEYRIESMIGQGGMGTVYKGVHRRIQRSVAVKLLRVDPIVCNDAEAVPRFEREVRAAAKLLHPNIVTAFD